MKVNKNKKVTPTKSQKTKRKVNKRNILAMVISSILVIGIIVGSCGLFVMGTMIASKPKFDINIYESKESSQIFDKNGELIADVGRQIRSNVTYDQIPNSLVDAFIAIEDSRFFDHNGFDLARFSKAILENLKSMSFSQGGSTLTMQLSKMTYFMDDESGLGAAKSVERKVQEIALAMELEKNTNKKAVFEMYLNKTNFGGSGNIRGVQKAANYYFDKDVSELTLPESAMLAGVVNAPGRYNPFRYLDYATNRRNTVLNMMLRHGYITQKEADLAKSVKVEDLLVDPNKKRETVDGAEYAYQSYIDTAVREVQELTGLDPTSVPMKIYTYMDKDVQTVMDTIQSDSYEGIEFPDDLMEIGMVSMNNQTGEIIGIGGGRNYGRGGSLLLNHATDQYKQPGSAVKPYLDYAPAFEYLGWATSHVVTDRPVAYRGTNKVIKNFNGKYYGQVTLKYAVGTSLNTPAIQTLQDVIDNVPDGRAKMVKYLQDLGFSKVTSDSFDLGYAIGGSSYECSVVELAAAHAVMLNGGNYIKPHTVSRIEFNDGTEPVEPVYTRNQVISAEAGYLTAQLMYEAVNGPYTNYMQLLRRDYPVYGKTGTTDWGSDGLPFNIPKGAAKDKWMVSETSQYTNVVWVGYEKGVKDKETYFTGKKSNLNIPGKISNALMKVVNDPIKPPAIAKPEGITSITHILGTWPYASVIPDMDPNFVTTGEIKKEFANSLVAPEAASIEPLGNFTATGSGDGTISLNWSPYPKPEQLVVAPDTMDVGLQVGNSWIEAWGKRIFDYTWIFGPVRYKARITDNGTVVKEVISESENFSETLDLGYGEHNVQVCGFYAYEWLGSASNEICTEIRYNVAPDLTTEVGCKADGKYWYDDSCHDAAKPTPDLSTEAGCKADGKYWYDGSCHEQPQVINPSPEETACKASATGATWEPSSSSCLCPAGYSQSSDKKTCVKTP